MIDYEKIYELLDKATPVPFDCGKICGAACCQQNEELDMVIILMPGEERMINRKEDWLHITEEDRKDYDLPESWGDRVMIARCDGPENCRRVERPIQCRIFPMMAVVDSDGEVEIVENDFALPYICPIIEEEAEISEEFMAVAKDAFEELIKDQRVRDLLAEE